MRQNLRQRGEAMKKKSVNYRTLFARGTILALASLSLMGCSTSGSREVLAQSVPGAPSYMRPVAVADPALGDDPYEIAARERAGRIQANRIIIRGATEWNTMAAEFKETTP